MRKKLIGRFWKFRGYKFFLRFTVNLLILLISPENTVAQTNGVINNTIQIDEMSMVLELLKSHKMNDYKIMVSSIRQINNNING